MPMNGIDRRLFLKTMAAGSAGVLPTAWHARVSAAAAQAHIRLKANPWHKQETVLPSDESGLVQNFTSVVEPLNGSRWRLWYSVSGRNVPFNVGIAEGKLGKPMKRSPAVLSEGPPADAPLAIGNLPRDWRPVQAVHVRLPGERHRLYFWAHGPQVVRYLAAESDDGRRYRVLDPHRPCLYHPADRAVDGATAAEAGLSRYAKKVATRPCPSTSCVSWFIIPQPKAIGATTIPGESTRIGDCPLRAIV